MHILIAPNAFKNSLTAREAAEAIKKGLKQSKLDCTCECFPIADGGDGTADLIIDKFKGRRIVKKVYNPLGKHIDASFGLIDEGRTAVIEMANASGLRLISKKKMDPLFATSFGTGQLISYALNEGVSKIIIGLGGSATVDGGEGLLRALGVCFTYKQNEKLSEQIEGMAMLIEIDLSGLDPRVKECEIIVLCDVENRMLGKKGAATVFGPQKGASPKDVIILEETLSMLRRIALKETGKDMGKVKHGGAAGGAAAGLFAFLDAKLVPGADYFLKLTGFEESLKKADLVITGEGSLDEQTLEGKGPFAVAQLAQKYNIDVIGLAGKVPEKENKALRKYFDVLLAIGNEPTELADAMQLTKVNLIRTAKEVGNLIALKK